MARPVAIDIGRLIEEATSVATETAARAPEHLQWIVFSKAFDAVMADWPGVHASDVRHGNGKLTPSRPSQSSRPLKATSSSHDRKQQLSRLNPDLYPHITHEKLALDNALHLLQIAKTELDIDGLGVREIAEILTENFRCKITHQGIQYALNNAGKLVDRRKSGNRVIFRIMAKGEDYIQKLEKEQTDAGIQRARKRPRSKLKVANESRKKAKTRSASANLGPSVAISKLYKEGYFSKVERTISDIAKQLKDGFGIKIKSNVLSSLMLLWIRNEKLIREENAKGQYAYKQP